MSTSPDTNFLAVPTFAQAAPWYGRRPSSVYSLPSGSSTRINSVSSTPSLGSPQLPGEILFSGGPRMRPRSRPSSPHWHTEGLRACRSEVQLPLHNFENSAVTIEDPNGIPLTADPTHTTAPGPVDSALHFALAPMAPNQLERQKYEQVKL